MSDLFPKMKEEVVDYGALESSIRNSCLQLGLQDVDGKSKSSLGTIKTDSAITLIKKPFNKGLVWVLCCHSKVINCIVTIKMKRGSQRNQNVLRFDSFKD